MATRTKIVKTFKLHGLSLQSEASRFLGEVLSSVGEKDYDGWLDRIIEYVHKQPLSSTLISKDVIEAAVQECSDQTDEVSDDAFNVISAFEVPRYKYNNDKKKFLKCTTKYVHLHPEAQSRSEMFQERYMIIFQRTIRHDLFAPPSAAVQPGESSTKYRIKRVEFLLGSTAKLGKLIVLGMIAQIKEGKYYLEDCTGVVQVDLSNTKYHTGLFTENCFVLAEGLYKDGVFHVDAIGCPPAEPAQVTRNYFGNINFFGGPSKIAVTASEKMQAIEEENQEAMFVILSDVWLDLPRVIAKLRVLFHGYHTTPPTLFIFCGNFISEPYGPKHSSLLRASLNNLADLISEYPSLLECSRFVFVPGPRDPGPGNILPRPPLPSCLTEEIRTKIPFAIFATNPCREDLVNKMCRNCIKLPTELGDIPAHFVKTIISQTHICPLPPHVRPVYWSFDNALRIYPLPDMIILADKYRSYVQPTTLDCICLNPGSFSMNDYCFKVYWPSSKEVEDSKIQD